MTAPDAPGASALPPDEPTTLAAALEQELQREAAFITALEAQLAAVRTDPSQGVVAAQALEAAVEAEIRRRWGPDRWVREVALQTVSRVFPAARLAEVGRGAASLTVTYGVGAPAVNQAYVVHTPVGLPPAGTSLRAGPVAAGLPWLKAPGRRALFQKRKGETVLYRWDWPPPASGRWEATVLQSGLSKPTLLFGASTPPGGTTEVVLYEQLADDVTGPAPAGSYRTRLTHYADFGAGRLARSWLPTERYLQLAAISNDGQTTTGVDLLWRPVPGLPASLGLRLPADLRIWHGRLEQLSVSWDLPQAYHWSPAGGGAMANMGWSTSVAGRWAAAEAQQQGCWEPDGRPATAAVYLATRYALDPVPLVGDPVIGWVRRPDQRYGSEGDTLPDEVRYWVRGTGCEPAAPTDLQTGQTAVDLQLGIAPVPIINPTYVALGAEREVIIWAHTGTGDPPGAPMRWSRWTARQRSWRPLGSIQWVTALSRDGQDALARSAGGQWLVTQNGGDQWTPCATPTPDPSPGRGAFPARDTALLLDAL